MSDIKIVFRGRVRMLRRLAGTTGASVRVNDVSGMAGAAGVTA
ncbi:hypothetical protein [Kitasatospora sp. NPDC090091]